MACAKGLLTWKAYCQQPRSAVLTKLLSWQWHAGITALSKVPTAQKLIGWLAWKAMLQLLPSAAWDSSTGQSCLSPCSSFSMMCASLYSEVPFICFPACTHIPYALQVRQRVLRGRMRLETPTCTGCLLNICRLEHILSKSWQGVREALMAKAASDLRRREAVLAEKERAAEEATTCSLCMDHPKGIVFSCGHQTCAECSAAHSDCPFCRKPISHRIGLFHS